MDTIDRLVLAYCARCHEHHNVLRLARPVTLDSDYIYFCHKADALMVEGIGDEDDSDLVLANPITCQDVNLVRRGWELEVMELRSRDGWRIPEDDIPF